MKKKLFALVLAVLLPIGLLAGSGDVNGDGTVDELDVKLIVDYIMGKSPENFNEDEADVNNDTEIDVADIVIVSNKILEQKNQMPQFDVSSTEISVTNTQEWPGFFVYLWTSDEIRQDVDVEIEYVTPADGEWLHYEGPWGGTGYQFLYDRNYSSADRVAKIHFKNDKYNVKSSVTVTAVYSEYSEDGIMEAPFLIAFPKEVKIPVLNKWLQFTLKVSTNDFLMDKIRYKIIDDTDDWIRFNSEQALSFLFDVSPNVSGENRSVKIAFYNDEYNLHDTAIVVSDPTISSQQLLKLDKRELLFTDSAAWLNFDIAVSAENMTALYNVEYEYLDGCGEWIHISDGIYPDLQGSYSKVFFGEITPNTKSLERIGRIVFKNETYDFRDTVTVHTIGYFKTKKKVYHVANQSRRTIAIEYETNLALESEEDYSNISAKVITANADWIHPSGIGIEYDNNETEECREALIELSAFNRSDTVKVISHPAEILNCRNVNNYILACQPSGDVIEVPIVGKYEGLQIDVYRSASDRALPKWVKRLPDRIQKDTLFVRFEVDANISIDKRQTYCYFQIGDGDDVWTHVLQPGCNAPSFAQQREALKVFYESTDGDHWLNNNNWLSDKPIYEWYGVNNDMWGNYVVLGNYVLRLQLLNNNLRGELPPEFSSLLPTCWFDLFNNVEWAISIKDNHIYGKIPENVKGHALWNEVGWQIIEQSFDSSLFDYDGFGLKTMNDDLDYMVDEDNPLFSVNDIIQQNELTLVHYAGDICPDWAWFTGITDERVNLYMDYRNLGLGMVMVTGRYWDESFDPFIDYVKKRHEHGVPKDIHWVKNRFGSIEPRNVGTDYLLDKEGNLIQIYSGSCTSESYCLPKIDSVCRARLGAPEEHEKFVSNYYTSSDYSKDGEVIKMQSSTVGDGIDVVFIGEAYLDTDMGEGGLYEQTMQEAMESFFSEEPYKSLRNRFNIYAVKAVSPNDSYVHGVTELAIGGSIEKAFEYAKKAVGERDDRLMVGVICKPGAIAERSQCFMFEEDGSFAAWMFTGAGKYVISHEMGGHGVAFLLDEYVENGWEESYPDEERKAFLDEMFAKYGEGANVDWRNDPSQVRWAHFINDSRFAAENIGVYEGACLYGKGCFRPTENSMMRYNDCGFNAPSREAIYKRVMKLSEGDDWEYDYETFVAFDAPAREAYKAAQSRSESRGTSAQQRRIESRPPTIYKGTWRDAGKCEKVEYTSKP